MITPVEGKYLLPFGVTPNDVLQRHRAALDGMMIDEPSRVMLRGNYFQDGALKWFCEEHNASVVEPRKGYRNKHCNLTASLDGKFMEPWHFGIETIPKGAVWECKMPVRKHEQVDSLERVLQVQAQMDCADTDTGVIAEQSQTDLIWRVALVRRHEPTIRAIRDAVNVFWDHMGNDTQYLPATSKEASQMVNGNRQPDSHDLTIGPTEEIPSEMRQHLISAADTYLSAKRTQAAANQMIEDTSCTMKILMGGFESVILPGNRKINHTTIDYKGQPEITKTIAAKPPRTTRRFSVKEI